MVLHSAKEMAESMAKSFAARAAEAGAGMALVGEETVGRRCGVCGRGFDTACHRQNGL